MFKWIGGSRQISQESALLPSNVDRGRGDFRGKLRVYERACHPRKRKEILMFSTFLGCEVIVYLLRQGYEIRILKRGIWLKIKNILRPFTIKKKQ